MQIFSRFLYMMYIDFFTLALSCWWSFRGKGTFCFCFCACAVLRADLITHAIKTGPWGCLIWWGRSDINGYFGRRYVIAFEWRDVIFKYIFEAGFDFSIKGNELLKVINVAVYDANEQLHICSLLINLVFLPSRCLVFCNYLQQLFPEIYDLAWFVPDK